MCNLFHHIIITCTIAQGYLPADPRNFHGWIKYMLQLHNRSQKQTWILNSSTKLYLSLITILESNNEYQRRSGTLGALKNLSKVVHLLENFTKYSCSWLVHYFSIVFLWENHPTCVMSVTLSNMIIRHTDESALSHFNFLYHDAS